MTVGSRAKGGIVHVEVPGLRPRSCYPVCPQYGCLEVARLSALRRKAGTEESANCRSAIGLLGRPACTRQIGSSICSYCRSADGCHLPGDAYHVHASSIAIAEASAETRNRIKDQQPIELANDVITELR